MTHARALNRRFFLLTAAAFVLATPAHADYVSAVQQKLQSQGFTEISVSYTLLGRSRIVAHGKRGTREIILNPKTGEVLRDLWTSASSGATGSSIFESDTAEDAGDDASDDGDDDGGKGRGRGRGRSGDGGDTDNSGSDGDSGGHGHSGGDGDSGGDDND